MGGRRRTPKDEGADALMAWYVRQRATPDAATERDIERSCRSKQPYASEDEAHAVAAMNGMKLYTYHCRYCDFWHLTRRPTSPGGPTED